MSIGTKENKSVEKGNREKRHFLQSMEKIIRLKPLAKEASSGRTKMRPLLPPPPSSRTTPIIPNTKRGKRMNSRRRKRSRREDYKRLGMITKLQQTDQPTDGHILLWRCVDASKKNVTSVTKEMILK